MVSSTSQKELGEKCSVGDVNPLDDLYGIEDVAFILQELNHKVDIQKEYKKKRTASINDEILVLQNKIGFYKRLIISTLEHFKEKSLKLPDVCTVSLRKARAKWIIDDEDALIEAAKAANEIDNIAKKVEGYKLIKKEADKLLNAWEQSEKLPDCVHKELGDKSISISYADKEDEIEEIDMTVPIKDEEAEYDGIKF